MPISTGPPSYSSDNLIIFLDAGNPASYPGTGSTLFDISNNRLLANNTATLGGNVPPAYSTDYGGFFFLDNNYYLVNSPAGLTGYIWPQASPSLFTNGYTLSFEIFFRPYVVGPNSGEATILTVGERYYVTIANPSSSTPRIAYVAEVVELLDFGGCKGAVVDGDVVERTRKSCTSTPFPPVPSQSHHVRGNI